MAFHKRFQYALLEQAQNIDRKRTVLMEAERELGAVVKAAIGGATVLTGNTRASRFVLSECDKLLGQQAEAWNTPDVLPFTAWVQRCFRDAQIAGATQLVLLNSRQSNSLWKQCIASSHILGDLLRPASASGQSSQAWQLVNAYRIPLDAAFELTAQSKAFAAWARRYRQVCQRNGWTDGAGVADELRLLVEAGNYRLEAKDVRFWGCGELTPQQRDLVTSFRRAGMQIAEHYATHELSRVARRIACDDSTVELQRAAGFARDLVMRRATSRVGVVVPKLREQRVRVETIFTQVLHPEYFLGADGARAFEIALGAPLAQRPVIKTALLILRFVVGELSFHEVRELLMSPFLGGAGEESGGRARLCRWLADHAPAQMSLPRLMSVMDSARYTGRDAEQLRRISVPRLRKVLSHLERPMGLPTRSGMSEWATAFGRMLRAAEWPGHENVKLQSADFQAYKKWLDLLSELASIDVTQGPLTFEEAVDELSFAASVQMFAPENLGARVQVMDDVEAEGSLFDHLWISGLTDETWPKRKATNAFIPAQVLRKAKVPGSSPESQVEEAAKDLALLMSSSPDVVVSFSRQEAERELRMSPAIADLSAVEWESLGIPDHANWIEQMPAAVMEEFVDASAPAIADADLLHRGTSLVEKQSACPFRAYAELRLSANVLDEPTGGIDPRIRGNLIEDVLENFWGEARDLNNYRGLGQEVRARLVQSAVDGALQKYLAGLETPAEIAVREIERERLIELTHEWLQLEEKRSQFDQVRHQQAFVYSVAGVELRGRIDRIDRAVTQLGEVILDYKSGAGTSYTKRSWETPRPRLPQLPLYAAYLQSQGKSVVGVAFAVLNTAKSKVEAMATSKEVFGNNSQWPNWAKPTLREQIDAWALEIEKLVKEHLAGVAAVDPKVPPSRSNSSCTYCHLHPMCRVAEMVIIDGDEEENSDE